MSGDHGTCRVPDEESAVAAPTPQAAPAVLQHEALARVCTLASGSSGNALLLELDGTSILVDVGLDGRRLARAMAALDRRVEDVQAVLLTHEHHDHLGGLEAFRERCPRTPVYASAGTAAAAASSGRSMAGTLPLQAGHAVLLGRVRVLPFAISHDAREPVGFRIDAGDLSVGIATDLGVAPAQIAKVLSGCRILVVEANHDEERLWSGRYPAFLKRRIASERGHLSNRQTLGLLQAVAHPALEHVVLAHLSGENNEPDLAREAVAPGLIASPRARVQAAPRREPGDALHVRFRPCAPVGPVVDPDALPRATPRQLPLFDAPTP